MALTVTLDPRAEELLAAHLRSGHYQSPEEVVTRALEMLSEKELPPTRRKKTPAEAVTHIRESRRGVTLGGIRIKDLIHAGHKF